MTATRRRLLGAAAAAALPAAPPARAQRQGQPRWEPSRPITLLVGFAPGGGTDIISRLLQPLLQSDLGQPVTVENRPGASGTLAALAGTRAPPDGHTLFMTTVSASAVVPPLMHPPPFDIYRDQTAIVLAARAGVRMTHVPFRGTGQAVNEILAGRIDLAIDTFPTYLPHIREGRVRALATTMPRRIEWLPDLPTVAETRFPGFDAPDFDANV